MEIKDYITVFDNALPIEIVSNFIKYINTQDKNFTPARINNYGGKDGKGVDFDVRRTWNLSVSPQSSSLTNVHWHNVLFFSMYGDPSNCSFL